MNLNNPLGASINNYIMKMALPLAGWFVVEYLIRNAAASSLALNFMSLPMMLLTLGLTYYFIKRMRQTLLSGYIAGKLAWSCGVQMTFYAGLIEALFIYVFNQYISPGNLAATQEATIQMYTDVLEQLKATGAYSSWLPKFEETRDQLRDMPIPSAIEAAISTLSNDLLFAIGYMIPLALIIRRKPNLDKNNA